MLFQPDKFSETGPNWVVIKKIDNFLLGTYWVQVEAKVKELIGVVKEVSAINGLEVNSKNYLIKGTKGIVVVKIIENTEHSNENTFLAINSRILERNIPAAKLSRIQPLKIGRHTIFFMTTFLENIMMDRRTTSA